MTTNGDSNSFFSFNRDSAPVSIRPPRRPYWLHALLLLLTVLTTLIVGARLQQNFLKGQPTFIADDSFFPLRWIWQDLSRLRMGIPFSATLLGILMAHELGHFLHAVRNRVYATLPFFLPAPTPIGTFGAFIQIKSQFRSLAALFDIGIAGPIAGFIVAVPMAAVGLFLSHTIPPESDELLHLGNPLIFSILHWVMSALHLGADHGPLSQLALHPIAIAAWMGMMATAFNLIPGGQLDGGHIVYALFPRAHRRVTQVAMLLLLPLAFFYWTGWLIWVIALGLTRRHPPVPQQPALPASRHHLAFVAVLILLLTFIPRPFPDGGIFDLVQQYFHH